MYKLLERKGFGAADWMEFFYYPYAVTEWKVTFKPLPLMKEKSEKIRVISNLFTRETSLFNLTSEKMEPLTNRMENFTLPINYEKDEREKNAKEFLWDIYVHKRKVWSNPTIEMMVTYSLVVPYGVYFSKSYQHYRLVELVTGNEAPLSNYKKIYECLRREGQMT